MPKYLILNLFKNILTYYGLQIKGKEDNGFIIFDIRDFRDFCQKQQLYVSIFYISKF